MGINADRLRRYFQEAGRRPKSVGTTSFDEIVRIAKMHLENFIIDANKPVHLAWWAEQFEVSEEALVAAIAAVGNRADAVRTYLEERKRRLAADSASLTDVRGNFVVALTIPPRTTS
jgi:hypothetical protein